MNSIIVKKEIFCDYFNKYNYNKKKMLSIIITFIFKLVT